MALIFANFASKNSSLKGNSGKTLQVDMPCEVAPDATPEHLVTSAVGAISALSAYLAANDPSHSVLVSIPDHPGLAAILTAVHHGLQGFEPRIAFVANGTIDVDHPIQTEDLRSSGRRLREMIVGTTPDGMPLPLPPLKIPVAFLCLGRTDLPLRGPECVRLDMPIALPAPLTPYSLWKATHQTALTHHKIMMKALQAHRVILGLPEHSALALTSLALWRGFLRKPPLLFTWPTPDEQGLAFDLSSTLDYDVLVKEGSKLRRKE